MKKHSTKLVLEKISEDLSSELTKYKYNKSINISDKYRKGKISSITYIQDLVYYFFQRDKELMLEFESIIDTQIETINSLNDGDYKKSAIEVLKGVKTSIKE